MGTATMVRNNFQTCIEACDKCAQACYVCYDACLNEPDLNARKNCVKMLVECAQMCEMSASLMSMNGQFAKDTVICVLELVMHVLKNVQCLKMTIVKHVQIFAVCVQMNVEEWLQCNSLQKQLVTLLCY